MSNVPERFRAQPEVRAPREVECAGILWDADESGLPEISTARWAEAWHEIYCDLTHWGELSAVFGALAALHREPVAGDPVPLTVATLATAIHGADILRALENAGGAL